jgi:hypothetical protein
MGWFRRGAPAFRDSLFRGHDDREGPRRQARPFRDSLE